MSDARTNDSSTTTDVEPSNGKLGVDIAVLWRGDMLTARFFARPATVTVGPDGTFTMPEDVIGRPLAVLVEPHAGAEFGLRIDHDKAHGHLIVDGDVHELDDVRAGKVGGVKGPVVPLSAGTRAVLVFGDFTFIVRRVPVPPPAKFALWHKEMLPFLLCFLAAVALVGSPIIAAFSVVGFRSHAEILRRMHEERTTFEIQVVEEIKPEEKPEEKEEEKKKEEEAPKLEPAAKQEEKKEEQQVEKEADKLKDDLAKLNEDERKEKVKELVAAETAKVDSAIDDALKDVQMPGTKLFAESDGSEGEAADPNGRGPTVMADPEGKAQGADLMGGGPKTSVGDKGDSTQRKVAAGLEKDSQAGKDVKLGMQEKKQEVIKIGGKVSDASGELPANVIQDFIRRKMGAIKACYQKGLQSNPDLQGTVRVMFLIQPTGAVGGAKIEDSSLGNAAVEECVLTNVKSWRFPQAKGGGSTTVKYPFRFSAR